jgi:hypothetical protein
MGSLEAGIPLGTPALFDDVVYVVINPPIFSTEDPGFTEVFLSLSMR